MLVETDAPDLAPMPHRGKDNEPAYVTLVGDALARATSRTVDDIADATTTNARRLFEFPA